MASPTYTLVAHIRAGGRAMNKRLARADQRQQRRLTRRRLAFALARETLITSGTLLLTSVTPGASARALTAARRWVPDVTHMVVQHTGTWLTSHTCLLAHPELSLTEGLDKQQRHAHARGRALSPHAYRETNLLPTGPERLTQPMRAQVRLATAGPNTQCKPERACATPRKARLPTPQTYPPTVCHGVDECAHHAGSQLPGDKANYPLL